MHKEIDGKFTLSVKDASRPYMVITASVVEWVDALAHCQEVIY